MRGDHLARQSKILPTMDSSKQGVTVAQLAEAGGCFPSTIWRDFPSFQAAGSSRLLYSRYLQDMWHPSQVFEKGGLLMTTEVGGLAKVTSWVLGFGTQAEVIAPEHLSKTVAEALAATSGRYAESSPPMIEKGPKCLHGAWRSENAASESSADLTLVTTIFKGNGR